MRRALCARLPHTHVGPSSLSPLLVSRAAAARPRICPPNTHSTLTHFARPLSTSRTMGDKMKAILIKGGTGNADSMYIGEADKPAPKKGEVLVKVSSRDHQESQADAQIKTFGLNRMDLLQREGKYPLPPQASKTIMGVEFAGTVEAVGESADAFKAGDEVFGLTYGGAYAEYVVADQAMLLPKPKELSWVVAAGIPENWLTAFQALFVEGGMKKGDNILIHAGASGVGVAAIQLALNVGQAGQVFTTAGSDDKIKFLQKLDSRVCAFNYRSQNFEEEIKKHTDGVDLIVDFVGRSYFTQNLSLLRRDGTLIYLAFLSGSKLDGTGADLATVLFKRLTIKGSTLRSRSEEYQNKLLTRFRDEALGLIRDGKMKVEVHEVFPWDKVAEAHKEMEANKNSGKIVFEIPQ